MALQNYAVTKLFYNGSPITQITRNSRAIAMNNQAIQLMNEGLGGFTDGSPEVRLEWDAPVPIGGPEFDYEGDATARAFVDMQYFIGAKSYAGRGKLESVNTEQSAGTPTSMSVVWVGEVKPVS